MLTRAVPPTRNWKTQLVFWLTGLKQARSRCGHLRHLNDGATIRLLGLLWYKFFALYKPGGRGNIPHSSAMNATPRTVVVGSTTAVVVVVAHACYIS